ncbi:MAG: 4-alpha-glucanotransferase [Mogibacterium sp.]|nr:4-alpha-glucanotransferase [Mogibacterium sp.]
MRASGILLPVFSLPSEFGIGDFSHTAKSFIERLAAAGQQYWQILPLAPAGGFNSPYQPLSCVAGDPVYISPSVLLRKGLLTEEDLSAWTALSTEMPADKICYEALLPFRKELLRKAFSRFEETPAYRKYCRDNADWLQDYALFTALRAHFGGISWSDWPEELRHRKPEALASWREKLAEEIRLELWIQYEFRCEWQEILSCAHENGVRIIGDIPIYASFDSAECWTHPELFKLRKDLRPLAVSGCPPDDFAPEGQRWGNPLYNWREHERTGFRWWIERLRRNFELYDMIRLDHMRGFESYYSIPAEDPTAMNGRWIKGPGMKFFKAVREALGDCRFIAEDLGLITPEVRKLIKRTGLPGMKVLQFAFDGDPDNPYLPENYTENCVVYTGTHDNDTTRGWYKSLSEEARQQITRYLRSSRSPGISETQASLRAPLFSGRSACELLVMLAMQSRADLCIIPIQDYLLLDSEARVNTPGTISDNWEWRMAKDAFTPELAEYIRRLTSSSGRMQPQI